MMVGSLKFSFNFYFFFFGFWLINYFNIFSFHNVNVKIDGLTLIITCLILMQYYCCGLPLLKWKHNTIITYGQNLSIVLIQLQISTCWHFTRAYHKEQKMAQTFDFWHGLAFFAPLIWSVASRLIHNFICLCSYVHHKFMTQINKIFRKNLMRVWVTYM